MILYKGAGPGTHWCTNDARLTGFQGGALIINARAALKHIVAVPYPSPFLSFSTSYAVAHSYASLGSSRSNPGCIYEIDTDLVRLTLYDPVSEIASLATNSRYSHYHDGGPDLILGVAASSLHGAVLRQPTVRRPTLPRALPKAPQISDELHGLVFAIRDAEVLIAAPIPAACILDRITVS